MTDPLTQIVTMLRPSAAFSKQVEAHAPWRVHRAEKGRPFYCLMLDGTCRLDLPGHAPVDLEAGDFVLVPEAQDFTMSDPGNPLSHTVEMTPVKLADGHFRLGAALNVPSASFLVGYCVFAAPDASILVSLLPRVVHVRGEQRLAILTQLIRDETLAQRQGREVVLSRLLEVLLIEGLRAAHATGHVGLLRGLSDRRIAVALGRMYSAPDRAWTVRNLAQEAGLSRSAFFERFTRLVGEPPMEHLSNWRMALAKSLLRENVEIGLVAERVGYSSPASFGTAFRRQVGMSPARFAKGRNSEQSSGSTTGRF